MTNIIIQNKKELDTLITQLPTTLEEGKIRALQAIENEKKNTHPLLVPASLAMLPLNLSGAYDRYILRVKI